MEIDESSSEQNSDLEEKFENEVDEEEDEDADDKKENDEFMKTSKKEKLTSKMIDKWSEELQVR